MAKKRVRHATRPEVRALSETISGCLKSPQAVDPFLIRQRISLGRFGEKIDEAFAGQPFLSTVAPTDRRNVRRFSKYLRLLEAMQTLAEEVDAMLLLLYGMDPATDAKVEMLQWQARAEMRAGSGHGGALGFANPLAAILPPRTPAAWRLWKQQVRKRLERGAWPEFVHAEDVLCWLRQRRWGSRGRARPRRHGA